MPRIVDKLSADLIQRLAASGSQCYEYKPLLCSGVVKKRNVENRFRLSQALPTVTATPAVCFDLFSKNSKKVKKVKKVARNKKFFASMEYFRLQESKKLIAEGLIALETS